jgi:endonuclease-3
MKQGGIHTSFSLVIPAQAEMTREGISSCVHTAALRGRKSELSRLRAERNTPMTPAQIDTFFATLQATNPLPASELEYTSVFELLAAVLLSAQATDVSVNKATRRLFPVANTPQRILDLGQQRLEDAIKTIGLFRSKARHLMATCRILIERHGGQGPRTREELEALPGVGRKTANVVLNVAYGEPTMAVDTHIFRVGNRTGLAPGKTPLAVEQKLLERVPLKYLAHAHHWLILHGRYVCLARTPRCWECAVAPCCDFAPKSSAPASR